MAENRQNVTNTATNTLNKNLVVPEVYAALTREKIAGKVVVAQFAEADYTLMGQPGETLNFPAWKYIGDAQDWTPGVAMTSTQMKQTNASATIKMVAAPAVAVNDVDDMVAFGAEMDEASEQQAISMSRKMDADCIAELMTAPMKSALAKDGEVTFDEIIDAQALFGDDFNVEDVDAILIHSIYKKSFIKMDGFVSRDLTYVNGADNGVSHNNCIGSFMGVPVVVSDRLVDGAKHPIVILKKGALKYIAKEAVFVEAERNAATRQTIVYCSDFYAVKLIKDDAVVVMTTTA